MSYGSELLVFNREVFFQAGEKRMRVTPQQAIDIIQGDIGTLAEKHIEFVKTHNANVEKLEALTRSHNQLLREFDALRREVQQMRDILL